MRVLEGLADAAAGASDQEILAEAREQGLDADGEASKIRAILLRAVKKAKRDEAQRQYKTETERLRTRQYRLPGSSKARRDLFEALLAARPQLKSVLTLQHREFDEMPDDDIESVLKRFDDLGLLDQVRRDQDQE